MRPFIVLLGLLSLSSCLESGLDFTAVDKNTEVGYNVSSTFSGANDEYKIIGISPSEGSLNLFLSYTGGCTIHSFKVVWNGEIKKEGDTNEVFLKLFHQSNNDECEALLKPVITIDLKSVLGRTPDENTKFIVQNASNGRTISIDPTLSKISQTDICLIRTSFENSLCGYGVWQNNWFKMEDSLGTDNAVWLQPVSHNPEINSIIPSKGIYDLGVTLLFGYQTPVDASCLTIPSGQVIPVEVNCISFIE